jgi:hypothetical protein
MSEYGYGSLKVWQKAKSLAIDVYRLTKSGAQLGTPTNEPLSCWSADCPQSAAHVPADLLRVETTRAPVAVTSCSPKSDTIKHDFSLIAQRAELGRMLGALVRARNNSPPGA